MEQPNSIFSDVFVAAAVAVAVVVAEALYSSKISQSLIYIYVAEMTHIESSKTAKFTVIAINEYYSVCCSHFGLICITIL